MSYNELLCIGILEVLINLISFHGFMKKNSTVVLLFRTWLVEYFFKTFVILQYNSKQLSSVPNEGKQIILAANIHKSDFGMACYTSITSVSNTINKLHVQSNLNPGYIHNLYHAKQ